LKSVTVVNVTAEFGPGSAVTFKTRSVVKVTADQKVTNASTS
jgi:hypothetical protein